MEEEIELIIDATKEQMTMQLVMKKNAETLELARQVGDVGCTS